MPYYCFHCAECGERFERYAPMCAPPDLTACPQCKRPAGRDYGAEQNTRVQRKDLWPMTSEAAAVDPSQIAEASAYDRRHGVPTDYTPTGEPILPGREHRRQYNRLHGFVDRSGGFGD